MKQGRTLTELSSELARQASAKRDLLLPASELYMASVLESRAHYLLADRPYEVADVAHGQIADYLGVPKAFYDRMRNGASALRVPFLGESEDVDVRTVVSSNGVEFCARCDVDGGGSEVSDAFRSPLQSGGSDASVSQSTTDDALFDVMVNCLMHSKGDEKRLVRTLDGRARALLSDSFNPDLDNYDVYAVAAKVIEEAGLGPDNVASCEVTERRLYLKVVSPRLEAVVRPSNIRDVHGYLTEPQVVQAGFVISNSEVGLGAIRVNSVIYKLMCTNLWVMEEGYRQRHLGKALEADNGENGDGLTVYKSDTRVADARARLLKLRDHVQAALDESRFQMLVARMQQSTEVQIGTSGGIEGAVDKTARKFSLTQFERDAVMRNLIEGADLSLWGLSNAVTATAGQMASYDRASDLETIGGKLLTMSDSETRELVTAR